MTTPVHRMLVPVDFSACSRAALEYALQLAPPLESTIEVLHVWEAPFYKGAEHTVTPGHPGHSLPEVLMDESRAELAKFVDDVVGDRFVTRTLVSGAPATVILEATARCDLLVMGRHGRTGISHLLLGSITEAVFKKVRCPILIVRRADAAAGAP
jgi:nucleotide-binding universal stress UspA family protein